MTAQTPAWASLSLTARDLRFAADVVHGVVGEVEVGTPEAEIIEALRWEADRADAMELARTGYPHLSDTERARVADTLLATITSIRSERTEAGAS